MDPAARPESSGAPVDVPWSPGLEMKSKKLRKPCRLLSTGLMMGSRWPCSVVAWADPCLVSGMSLLFSPDAKIALILLFVLKDSYPR